MLGYISTVTNTDLVSAAKFNEIQNQVYQLVGPNFYNYDGFSSHSVTSATVISVGVWGELYNDLNRAIVHQTNDVMKIEALDPYSSTLEYPVSGAAITATFVNSLIKNANQAYINSSTASPSQLTYTITNSTSSRVTNWNAPMEHVVQYSWVTSGDCQGFFALGGYMRPHVESAGGSGTADDLIWRQLVLDAEVNLQLTANQFHYPDWAPLPQGGTKVVTVASNVTEQIVVTYTKVNYNQVTVKVRFITDELRAMDINMFSTVYAYYSLGNVGPVPHGYQARGFDVITTTFLSVGGFNEFKPRRAIKLSPSSLSFSGYTTSTLQTRTLSISNVGNTVTNVSLIYSTYNGNSSLTVTPNTFPLAINSGTTATVNITYTGNDQGVFQNTLTVDGDFDAGPSAIGTTLTLTNKPFSYTLTPTSYLETITVSKLYDKQFNIVPSNGVYYSYTATFTDTLGGAPYAQVISFGGGFFGVGFNFTLDSPPGFTLKKVLGGPIVEFNPVGRPQGSYNAYISTYVNGLRQDAAITYNNQIQQSYNLGKWVSSLGYNNAVVGMSYDLIAGNRYLTIGVGMGANGSKPLDAGGSVYVDTNNLRYDADDGYQAGEDARYQCTLYKAPTNNSYGGFLNTYGVWIDNASTGPLNAFQTRSYRFTVPESKNYDYEFSVDNYGYFDIDGQQIITQQNNRYYTSKLGQVYISAGEHTVTIHMSNIGGAAAIGLRISDATTGFNYWDTLRPIRSLAYSYWQEVYRIPIAANGTAQALYNAPYCVKDTGAVNGNRWSDYFGDTSGPSVKSMFAITDDGTGHLGIYFLGKSNTTGDTYYDTTIANIQYLEDYYIAERIGKRYSQLEDIQAGNQTHQFNGFLADGTVETTLVGYAGYQAGSGSGGVDLVSLGVAAVLTDITVATVADVAGATVIGEVLGVVFSTGFFCFAKDTRVKMADGSYKEIADVKIGDKVFNHNGKSINTVKFITKSSYTGELCSHDRKVKPFVSKNHPLIFDGILYSYDPYTVHTDYTWLGDCSYLIPQASKTVSQEPVYNLLVDGDGTYNVNDIGTTSVIGDGGAVVNAVEQGIITEETAMNIMRYFHTAGGYRLRAWHWANQKFKGSSLFVRALAKLFK